MSKINWEKIDIEFDESTCKKIDEHNQRIYDALPLLQSQLINEGFIMYSNAIDENRNLIDFIINYHDIGKTRSILKHEEESYNIIRELNLLLPYKFNKDQEITILNIIKDHLLLGGVFNGEYSIVHLENFITQNTNDTIILFIIFSALDVAGYVNDMAYVFRLFKNYVNIITKLKNKERACYVYHLKWRLCCLLACYKRIDYDDEQFITKFLDKLHVSFSKAYQIDKNEMLNYFAYLSNINLHYAIWLLGRLTYLEDEAYQRADIDKINICPSFFALLDEIKNSIDGCNWDVYFYGYRENQQRAETIFSKLRFDYNNNFFIKEVDTNNQEMKITFL